jgi:putative transcriptional regulator
MPIIRKTLEQIEREGGGAADLARIDATTDEEIARQIADDPDTAPELTEADLDRATVVRPDGSRTPYRSLVRQKAPA